MKHLGPYLINEELRLKKTDKRVINAFIDGNADDNNKFETDGKRIDGPLDGRE